MTTKINFKGGGFQSGVGQSRTDSIRSDDTGPSTKRLVPSKKPKDKPLIEDKIEEYRKRREREALRLKRRERLDNNRLERGSAAGTGGKGKSFFAGPQEIPPSAKAESPFRNNDLRSLVGRQRRELGTNFDNQADDTGPSERGVSPMAANLPRRQGTFFDDTNPNNLSGSQSNSTTGGSSTGGAPSGGGSSDLVFEVRDSADTSIPDNVLNNYINVQYHMVFSMVDGEIAPEKVQKGLLAGNISLGDSREDDGLGSLGRSLKTDKAIVIASTGGVFDEEIGEINSSRSGSGTSNSVVNGTRMEKSYYNIVSLNLENITSPTATNSFVSTMLLGNMELHEPHGFNFHEDIRSIADRIGYQDINVGRVIYRLDVFFSGYSQDTGEWENFIKLNVRKKGTGSRRLTYYFNISKLDAKVSSMGTDYAISMVPCGHIAYRPEEVTLKATTLLTVVNSSGSSGQGTFGGFLKKLAEEMTQQMKQQKHQHVEREFEFFAPEVLKNQPFFSGDFKNTLAELGPTISNGSKITGGKNINALTLVEAVIKDIPFVWDRFIKDDDQKHLLPRTHWGMRFNVVYEEGANPEVYDFKKIKMQYIIEPYLTYKKGTVEKLKDAEAQTDKGTQLERIQQLLNFGMIDRVYNYINTSENVEVINYDISLNAFYYRPFTTQQQKANDSGASTVESESGVSGSNIRQDFVARGVSSSGSEFSNIVIKAKENTTSSSIERLFGPSAPAVDCPKSGYDILGGGLNELAGRSLEHNADHSPSNVLKNRYTLQLDDHFRNDLMKLENLQVRGDPIWMLSNYGVFGSDTLKLSSTDDPKGVIKVRTNRIIFLKIIAPNQNDFMDPNRGAASSSCSIIGGFYEILKIKSTFQGGRFTQILEGFKLDNLNFADNKITTESNDSNNEGIFT